MRFHENYQERNQLTRRRPSLKTVEGDPIPEGPALDEEEGCRQAGLVAVALPAEGGERQAEGACTDCQ